MENATSFPTSSKVQPSTKEATSSSNKRNASVQKKIVEEVEEQDDEETAVDMYTITPDTTLKWDLLEETIERLRVIFKS